MQEKPKHYANCLNCETVYFHPNPSSTGTPSTSTPIELNDVILSSRVGIEALQEVSLHHAEGQFGRTFYACPRCGTDDFLEYYYIEETKGSIWAPIVSLVIILIVIGMILWACETALTME